MLVEGDAVRTTANIVGHETLFRLGIVADILMATVFVLLGLVLHRLLHHVHERAATALLVFVSVGAGSILVNLTFHVGALLAATRPGHSPELVLLLLDLHQHGYVLGGVFFGLWLLPMGFLACRSPLLPTWLGVLAIVASVAWVADPVLAFGLPDAPALIRHLVELPTSIGELSLLLYLLICGIRSGQTVKVQMPEPGSCR
ncbi:hypothetical protein Adi01nite_49620 [Amorphoplanes digitatis]|uniref:DUF4386 domain-containing protein n=1 Tax=Actinoplanes digitatis TaxID=1868 RepID=A0A7W7I682_9ACTN|nr:hypothetical protein [Actinoplanes digitatis]GID95550.1 hypothetical protein Adi01nite_49620 [Actinoplanes digitatis]